MSTITFPVVSRFTGTTKDSDGNELAPAVVTRALGTTTQDKVIDAAATCGWSVEHGYEISLQGKGGGLAFRSADGSRRVNMEFGVKGQLTWLCITRQGEREFTVNRERYAAVCEEFLAGRKPAEAEPKFDYKAWREVKRQKVDAGDVGEFGRWLVENPSPIQAKDIFGEPRTREALAAYAVREVAHCFKGTEVEISYTAAPGTWATEGTIVGLATNCAGNESVDALLLQAPSGNFLTIPVSKIVHLDNKDA